MLTPNDHSATVIPYTPTIPDPRFVRCIKIAGIRILFESRQKRMEIDIDMLLREALEIYERPDDIDVERLIRDAREFCKGQKDADAG